MEEKDGRPNRDPSASPWASPSSYCIFLWTFLPIISTSLQWDDILRYNSKGVRRHSSWSTSPVSVRLSENNGLVPWGSLVPLLSACSQYGAVCPVKPNLRARGGQGGTVHVGRVRSEVGVRWVQIPAPSLPGWALSALVPLSSAGTDGSCRPWAQGRERTQGHDAWVPQIS